MGQPLVIPYINVIFNTTDNGIFRRYADDTRIFMTGNNPNDMIKAPNEVLSYLKELEKEKEEL